LPEFAENLVSSIKNASNADFCTAIALWSAESPGLRKSQMTIFAQRKPVAGWLLLRSCKGGESGKGPDGRSRNHVLPEAALVFSTAFSGDSENPKTRKPDKAKANHHW
jgi:hypothetical protein